MFTKGKKSRKLAHILTNQRITHFNLTNFNKKFQNGNFRGAFYCIATCHIHNLQNKLVTGLLWIPNDKSIFFENAGKWTETMFSSYRIRDDCNDIYRLTSDSGLFNLNLNLSNFFSRKYVAVILFQGWWLYILCLLVISHVLFESFILISPFKIWCLSNFKRFYEFVWTIFWQVHVQFRMS